MGQRVAVIGDIVVQTNNRTEKIVNGYHVLGSSDSLTGAGRVANELRAAGDTTLLVGIVCRDSVATVKRLCRGFSWLMTCDAPSLTVETFGDGLRIERGVRPVVSPADAARMVSQVVQFRPDVIRLVDCPDVILEAVCVAGLGGLIHRDEPSQFSDTVSAS